MSDSKDDKKKSKKKKKIQRAQVSAKHTAQFVKLFSLPDSEKLIGDFSCAFQRDVLVHGRMYLSQNYLCFHATVFGWVTVVILPFVDIKKIEKRKMLVIPNAIGIETENDKYFFASFLVRDQAYRKLMFMWHNTKCERPKTAEDILDMEEGEMGWEGMDTSRDIDSTQETDLDEDDEEQISNELSEALKQQPADVTVLGKGVQTWSTQGAGKQGSPNEAAADEGATLADEPLEEGREPCGCLKSEHKNVTSLSKFTVGASVSSVYNIVFGDDSNFIPSLFDHLGNMDLSITKWKEENASKTRTATFKQTVRSPLGVKTTNVCETQTHVRALRSRSCVETLSQTSGVPYADHFYVHNRYCFWGDDNKTEILVTCELEWLKSTWLKTTIEKSAYDACKKYLVEWSEWLTKTAAEQKAPERKARKPRKSRKTSGTLPPSSAASPKSGPKVESKEDVLEAPAEDSGQGLLIGFLLAAMILLFIVFFVMYFRLRSLEDGLTTWQSRTMWLEAHAEGADAAHSMPTSGTAALSRGDWYLRHHHRFANEFESWREQLNTLDHLLAESQKALRELGVAVVSSQQRNLLADEQAGCVQRFLASHSGPMDSPDALRAEIESSCFAPYGDDLEFESTWSLLSLLWWLLCMLALVGAGVAIGRFLA